MVADHLRRDAARVLRPEGPARGHGPQLDRGVAVVPDLPPLLRPDLPRGQGPRAGPGHASSAYNDWMVEEWCGDSGGRLIPLTLIPLWDPSLGGRGGPAQRGAGLPRRVLQRDPPSPRAAEHPHRALGPVLRGVPGDRDHRVHAHRVVVQDAGDVTGRPRGGDRHAELRQRDGVAQRLPVLRRAGALPDPEARLLGGPDRVAALHPRAGRRRLGRPPGVGRASRTSFPSRPRATTTSTSSAASSRTGTVSSRSTGSASTTSRSRPTTRTPTRRGPTPRRSPPRWSPACPTTSSTRSCGATPSACSTSISTHRRRACGAAPRARPLVAAPGRRPRVSSGRCVGNRGLCPQIPDTPCADSGPSRREDR